jgi:hypothetical protein
LWIKLFGNPCAGSMGMPNNNHSFGKPHVAQLQVHACVSSYKQTQ